MSFATTQNHSRRPIASQVTTLSQRKLQPIATKNAKISSSREQDHFRIFSLTDSAVKLSEFTDLPLLNLDRDISSCHNVEAMDTPTLNMDSLDFYFEQGGLKVKHTEKLSPTEDIDLLNFALSDLDPEVEESVDIQDLIEKTSIENVSAPGLFPELEAPSFHQPTAVGKAVEGTSLTVLSHETEQEDGQMPHQIVKLELPSHQASAQASANVITISAEDLASLTNALDGPVIVNFPTPSAKEEDDDTVPEIIEYVELDSPGSTISEAVSSVSAQYITPIPTPLRRGPKPKTGKAPSSKSRRRAVPKESEEYKDRRARNNVAVRKSRDKAKQKQEETHKRVQELTDQNKALQKKCDLLTKELSVLKGLFTNVGATMPPELSKYFGSK